ncbi:MAG: hypothetical protein ACI8T1_000149 [Verrucomicrobiales bacterium]
MLPQKVEEVSEKVYSWSKLGNKVEPCCSQSIDTLMKRLFLIAYIFMLTPISAQNVKTLVQLERAIFTENNGNLPSAITHYEALLEAAQLPPAKRQETLFRTGRAWATLENETKSRETLRNCLTEFPEGAFATEIKRLLSDDAEVRDQLRQVDLLGLWSLDEKDYLEFRPRGVFHRWPHPMDSVWQTELSPPIESGTYEVQGDQLIITLNAASNAYSWKVTGSTLTLQKDNEPAIERQRVRRPYRFPATVEKSAELQSLLKLKASEAS